MPGRRDREVFLALEVMEERALGKARGAAGSYVYVEGQLENRTYDKDSEKRTATEIVLGRPRSSVRRVLHDGSLAGSRPGHKKGTRLTAASHHRLKAQSMIAGNWPFADDDRCNVDIEKFWVAP
jgi:single-stranded DNA-binding protein